MNEADDISQANVFADTLALDVNDQIIVINRESVFNSKVGIITKKKHMHYRVNINGKNIWLPKHWVTKTK